MREAPRPLPRGWSECDWSKRGMVASDWSERRKVGGIKERGKGREKCGWREERKRDD